MRFLHLSDLHLGKRVCEFSMLDDQRYILEQILSLLDSKPVDGVLLAGDLYDKPVPPAEAVRLLDWFLTQLAERRLPVFAISGNHDSADRIAFDHLNAPQNMQQRPDDRQQDPIKQHSFPPFLSNWLNVCCSVFLGTLSRQVICPVYCRKRLPAATPHNSRLTA